MDAVAHLAPTVGVLAACDVLGVARASFYRQRPMFGPPVSSAPESPLPSERPAPARSLSAVERAGVLNVLLLETLVHERRNGQFVLLVTGHPNYGLPWGQDRLVPLFLATLATRRRSRRITFASAAEMLETFGMQQGGSQYRRLVGAFQRIFGATIFFGTDTHRSMSSVVHEARFHFMSEARIWYARDPTQQNLPEDCQNLIVLTEEFYQEVTEHPIPTDLEAAKALSSSPAALNLFTWLSYRCFVAKGEERIPLFGEFGLANQLGCGHYSRLRRFRERLEYWLILVRVMWPECPARISRDGQYLLVDQANALTLGGSIDACA